MRKTDINVIMEEYDAISNEINLQFSEVADRFATVKKNSVSTYILKSFNLQSSPSETSQACQEDHIFAGYQLWLLEGFTPVRP